MNGKYESSKVWNLVLLGHVWLFVSEHYDYEIEKIQWNISESCQHLSKKTKIKVKCKIKILYIFQIYKIWEFEFLLDINFIIQNKIAKQI